MSDLNFLLEIGTEEIPDWMIEDALAYLKGAFTQQLEDEGLSPKVVSMDATPRRLTLRASVQARQQDKQVATLGPNVKVALKDATGALEESNLTPAGLGFVKKNQVSIDRLRSLTDAKGATCIGFTAERVGRDATAVLTEKIPGLILSIPWPKTMFWTAKGGPRFIRPIRWLVALLDDQVVPMEVAGVAAGSETATHRQLGSGMTKVTYDSYEAELWRGGVLVSAQSRKDRIEKGIHDLVHDKCMTVVADAPLLQTLVYLTEYPTPILGYFDEKFLALPREVLIEVMKKHQRYFSVVNQDGRLMPMFIAVTNTDGDPEGLIRRGHERVLKARFQDAKFFWEADNHLRLAKRVDSLKSVTFHAKLGSYYDKTQRTMVLAEELAKAANADVAVCRQAAELLKCDLTCEMVKEFTDLQGIIGGIYAKQQGEDPAVAEAIYDHYRPLSMEDRIPKSLNSQVVALADKVDTLRECFRIGMAPTGSKDPFALRRAAQGVLKILVEGRLPISLDQVAGSDAVLKEFMLDRARYYFREVKQFAYDEVNAAVAPGVETISDLAERLKAIQAVRPTENFEPLAAGLKRIRNILKQSGVEKFGPVDEALLEAGDQNLYRAFQEANAKLAHFKSDRNYISALATIAALRPAVDSFFDQVMVNVPDAALRANRLALLNQILEESSTIADFSEIVTS
jgi:glycyl-tRNA synthetase beta chain